MPATVRPKVLLLIPHLGGGGAEQVAALLARGLSPEKYEVSLGLITQGSAEPGAMPRWVTIHAMGASRVRACTLKLLRLVHKVKPDVILSGMFHLNFLVLLLRPFFPMGTKVLIRQNGTASAALSLGKLPGYMRLLYRLLYGRADKVICQTAAMAKDLSQGFKIADRSLVVLANPVDVESIRSHVEGDSCLWPVSSSTGAGPHLLAVGRLSREKGFGLLLRAMADVRRKFMTADLVIAGTGREESSLKALCHELGLEDAVRFAGYVDQPAEYFSGASAFVLSSRHEGLPNALLQAAAGGLPLVALPASEGMVELLRGLPGVWLAEDISCGALSTALLSAFEVIQPGERFAHDFVERFRMDGAIRAYEELIDSTLYQSTKLSAIASHQRELLR